MIAKRISREKSTSDFGRLGRYILEARNDESAILWTRTAEYILDAKGQGEKVAWSRITHCNAEIPILAIEEILLTQANNTRAKSDKTYHLVISFREGEQPSREQLEDIEDSICTGLGYAEHQRISAVHKDTDNVHIHIAINKIHPVSFRCIEPYYDKYRLNDLCRDLEIKHGLEQDNRIESTLKNGKTGDMEAHTREESLLRWVRENALPAAKTCNNWQELHTALVDYGLQIKPRGAGLVIGLNDGSLHVKASSVDRSLSMKALTDRLGEYEPPSEQIKQMSVKNQYHRRPRDRHVDSEPLYAEYQKQRQVALQTRQELKGQLRQEYNQYSKELNQWYAGRRSAIQANKTLTGKQKFLAYQALSQERKVDFEKRRRLEAEQRKAILAAHPLQTWQEFLVEAAEQGNTVALAVLRNRQRQQTRLVQAVLTAENAEEAKHIIYQHLKPQARKNGDIVYRVQDGGIVADEAKQIRVEEVTEGSAFLALMLAGDRFKDRPLKVEGTDEFKHQVVQLAVQHGLKVQFANLEMEQARQKLCSNQEQQMPIKQILEMAF